MNYRHIEFRGYDKLNKVWVTMGFPIMRVEASQTEPTFFTIVSNPAFEVVHNTGVFCSKNTKIWEGDIVRRACFAENCAPIHIGIVEYDPSAGCYSIVNHDIEDQAPLVWYYKDQQIGIEKLGNIYDNPNMLKTMDQKVAEIKKTMP